MADRDPVATKAVAGARREVSMMAIFIVTLLSEGDGDGS